ncbi:hypothetical protein BJV78DRAFT_1150700 [Lactifluus subvellereus]|nr:hypothetical protein BJV78DRAFT_1150700 [Lactifluus subvellereus]
MTHAGQHCYCRLGQAGPIRVSEAKPVRCDSEVLHPDPGGRAVAGPPPVPQECYHFLYFCSLPLQLSLPPPPTPVCKHGISTKGSDNSGTRWRCLFSLLSECLLPFAVDAEAEDPICSSKGPLVSNKSSDLMARLSGRKSMNNLYSASGSLNVSWTSAAAAHSHLIPASEVWAFCNTTRRWTAHIISRKLAPLSTLTVHVLVSWGTLGNTKALITATGPQRFVRPFNAKDHQNITFLLHGNYEEKHACMVKARIQKSPMVENGYARQPRHYRRSEGHLVTSSGTLNLERCKVADFELGQATVARELGGGRGLGAAANAENRTKNLAAVVRGFLLVIHLGRGYSITLAFRRVRKT